jgi:hypothetical protein
LTLYIRSSKKATGIEERGGYAVQPTYAYPAMDPRLLRTYNVQREIEYEYTLSDEQRKVVRIVETLAREYGFKLLIVDVTKQSSAKRLLKKELRQIKVFPTLVLDSGERLQGFITRDSLRTAMSKNRSQELA